VQAQIVNLLQDLQKELGVALSVHQRTTWRSSST
jgi:ABC-type oligopeptide transport system ATPase subunit